MELRHLRYFCAVAEEKNMTRAAEKIFMAQPPLTRQIKQLEEEVGVQLVQREARGISLTPAGEYFWQQAQLILDKLEATVKESHGSRGFLSAVWLVRRPPAAPIR